MAHLLVAANAPIEIHFLARIGGDPQGAVSADLLGEIAMATDAVGLENLGIAWLDADGLLEILEGEGLGMVITVAGFHEELVGKVVMRQMTVVADGVRMVGRVPPVVVFLAHDVAVHADLRIV